MERLKEVLGTYSVWGGFIALVTVLIRPFISIRHTLRDSAITFLVSMLSGLLCEYLNIPDPVRYGLSGVCGLFAVRIYMIAEALLKKIEQDPENFIKQWKKKEK